jgi:uncharacterized delta-60 repeat protein
LRIVPLSKGAYSLVNIITVAIVLLLFAGLCPAQTQFARAVGGAGYDKGCSGAQTFDGGYIVTGVTSSFGSGDNDLFLSKFNSAGELTWARTGGGALRDGGNSVVQTSDGGYIVTGWTMSFGTGFEDLFIGKFNSFGGLTWAKTMGGADLYLGHSVAPTFDGGYIVTGSFSAGLDYDLFLSKFNSFGDLTWAKTVGGADLDLGFSVAPTSDGGYIVTGETQSFGAGVRDLFLAKFNSTGDLTWAKTVGGMNTDRGYSVAPTSDGGYIVTGYTDSFGAGLSDLFVAKFNSTGDLTWAKNVGGTNNDRGYSVTLTSDGGYIVTGETESFGAGNFDLFLCKFNSSGDLTWAKTVGGALWDEGKSVAPTSDGGYIVTGRTRSFGTGCDLFLVKFDSDGNSCIGSAAFPTVMDITPSVDSVSPTVTVPSLSISGVTPTITNVVPTITVICTDISEVLSKPISFELTVSPNPFNSSCAITTPTCATVKIFDLQGKLVWNKPSDSDNIGATSLIKGGKPDEVPLNKGYVAKRQGVSASAQGVIIWQPDETISSGVYLVRATTDDGQQITKRIVYLK